MSQYLIWKMRYQVDILFRVNPIFIRKSHKCATFPKLVSLSVSFFLYKKCDFLCLLQIDFSFAGIAGVNYTVVQNLHADAYGTVPMFCSHLPLECTSFLLIHFGPECFSQYV